MTDTIPSLPMPPTKKPVVDLGGFAFTAGGLAHPLTQADSENLLLAALAPLENISSIARSLGLS